MRHLNHSSCCYALGLDSDVGRENGTFQGVLWANSCQRRKVVSTQSPMSKLREEIMSAYTIPCAPHWEWRAIPRRWSSLPSPSTPHFTKWVPCLRYISTRYMLGWGNLQDKAPTPLLIANHGLLQAYCVSLGHKFVLGGCKLTLQQRRKVWRHLGCRSKLLTLHPITGWARHA